MICPGCKKELDHIHVHAHSSRYQKVNIDSKGRTLKWSSPEISKDTDIQCPYCCEDLTNLISL